MIWLRGSRFRVKDEAGRPYRDILADVTAGRGFGSPPRTMEDFMDAFDASVEASDLGPTELFGDVASGDGIVRQPRGEPWSVDADRLAPVAEQVLTDDRLEGLASIPSATCFDRPCREVRYTQDGQEDGVPYRSEVRVVLGPPFVLLREVRDAVNPALSAVTEVVELEEGIVTDAELTPA